MFLDIFTFTCFLLPLWVRVHAAVSTKTCEVEKNPHVIDQVTDSWMYRELSLSDPVSVLDCAVRCIQDTSCVTFMVNLASKRCRFHAARISSQNSLTKKEGFASYDTCRAADAFGTKCSGDHDCKLLNTRCVDVGSCECEPGWSYSPNTLSCVRECAKYGTEFTVLRRYFITLHNMARFFDASDLTLDGCARRCVAYSSNTCKTADLDLDVRTCFLANVTKLDVPRNFFYWSTKDIYHMQRHCAYQQ